MTLKVNRKLTAYLIVIVIVIAIAGGITQYLSSKKAATTNDQAAIEKLAKPTATAKLDKSFEIQITDPKNKPISLKYTLTDAKKVRYITMADNPVYAENGKEIMIISVELTNDSNYPLTVNSQDFIRMIGADGKRYAADYYNGQVDVAPISVRKDELAYLVDENQKSFKFQLGEVDKEKQDLEIAF